MAESAQIRDQVSLSGPGLVTVEPMGVDEALTMRGTGWDGDLEGLRDSRVA